MSTKYGVFKRELLGNQTLVILLPRWISTMILNYMAMLKLVAIMGRVLRTRNEP